MNVLHHLRAVGNAALELVYPPFCTVCLASTESHQHLCIACRREAPAITGASCQVCSQPYDGQIESAFTCPRCQERSFHFESAIASYRSLGVVREVIHQFKYNGKRHLRHMLGEWLGDNLADPRLHRPFERIVPVPLHPARERERGFNQARVLALLLSKRTGVPLGENLKRIRFTTTQTHFNRETRMENLRNAFRIRHTAEVRNLHILLIDDVLTTGSTVDECARVLMEAGAASVRVAAVARG